MAKSSFLRQSISYALILGLALIFVLEFGPGARGCTEGPLNTDQTVANVNGQPIGARTYAVAYSQELESLRSYGFTPELARKQNFPKLILDRLVNTELLSQEARRRGIITSATDLEDVYHGIQAFQKDGRFDRQLFLNYLQAIGESEVQFEDKLRAQISSQRLLSMVGSFAQVSPEELRAAYRAEANTAKVEYVRFSPTMFAATVNRPTDAEVAQYRAKHATEVNDAYEKAKEAYSVPERVRARQIVKLTGGTNPQAKEALEKLRAEVTAGARTFAEVAKASSDDAETKAKGGDLGIVDRASLPPAFADALFAAEPGSMTAVIETPKGFFLGFLEEKIPASVKPLKEVESSIARALLVKERSALAAEGAARRALAAPKAKQSLEALFPTSQLTSSRFAREQRPTAKTTDAFPINSSPPPGLEQIPELTAALEAQKSPGLLPKLLRSGDDWVLVRVVERKHESDADFKERESDLQDKLLAEHQNNMKDDFIKALRSQAKLTENQKLVDRLSGIGE